MKRPWKNHRALRHLCSDVRERGQVLVLVALGFAVLAGLVGMSIDVGQIVFTRTDLQKTSDAAALAGAQDLPITAVARVAAEDYVGLNGGAGTTASVTFGNTNAANDTIEVESTRRVEFSFLKLLGMDGTDVSAKATVTVGHYVGGTGVLPWGFIADLGDPDNHLLGNSCFAGVGPDGLPDFTTDVECTLKFGAGSNAGGDFGALAIGGTGANVYRNNIKYGSSVAVKKGDLLDPQTGNMQGPTRQAVDERLAGVSSQCNEKDELVTPDGESGYYVNDGCAESPNIIVIPVVDRIDNPHLSEVLGFAYMWLYGSTNAGGHSAIVGEFLTFVEELPNGIYEGFGEGPVSIKLVD